MLILAESRKILSRVGQPRRDHANEDAATGVVTTRPGGHGRDAPERQREGGRSHPRGKTGTLRWRTNAIHSPVSSFGTFRECKSLLSSTYTVGPPLTR